jgi:hypothetical protein
VKWAASLTSPPAPARPSKNRRTNAR